MISLTTLYDGYMYRPELTDHRNPFEYIFSPPPHSSGSEQLGLKYDALRGILAPTMEQFHEDCSKFVAIVSRFLNVCEENFSRKGLKFLGAL